MRAAFALARPVGAIAVALLLGTASGAGAAQSDRSVLRLAQQDDSGPTDAGDSSAMVVRLGRLENQVRALTGQIEQLQFQNKRLEDNLRKMQGDVDFRFQDLQRGGGNAPPTKPATPLRRSEADTPDVDLPADAAPDAAPAVPAPAGATPPARRTARTGDAFDPDANPDAPGAPRPLGSTAPSTPLAPRPRAAATDTLGAPLDLTQRPPAGDAPPDVDPGTPSIIAAPPAARDPNAVASLTPGSTREEYDGDIGLYRQGQYDGAATALLAFASKYPRDRLVPDAVFMAGESYARLGRHREAAEQFLKVTTDYGKSTRAPDALLRLGISLNALGAKDQACATYLEVTRRYPAASNDVRSGVDREIKRARCPASG